MNHVATIEWKFLICAGIYIALNSLGKHLGWKKCTSTLNAVSILCQFDPGKDTVGGSCDFLVMVKETPTLNINVFNEPGRRADWYQVAWEQCSLIFTTIVKTDVWIADMLSWHVLRWCGDNFSLAWFSMLTSFSSTVSLIPASNSTQARAYIDVAGQTRTSTEQWWQEDDPSTIIKPRV